MYFFQVEFLFNTVIIFYILYIIYYLIIFTNLIYNKKINEHIG